VQWNKPPGYCSAYVSDTSTSAVSKTCVSSQNCLEKYIDNILFFVSFGPKYIDNILLKEVLFRNKGLVNTRIQLQQNYPAIRWRNHSPANVFSVNIRYHLLMKNVPRHGREKSEHTLPMMLGWRLSPTHSYVLPSK